MTSILITLMGHKHVRFLGVAESLERHKIELYTNCGLSGTCSTATDSTRRFLPVGPREGEKKTIGKGFVKKSGLV